MIKNKKKNAMSLCTNSLPPKHKKEILQYQTGAGASKGIKRNYKGSKQNQSNNQSINELIYESVFILCSYVQTWW